jgi:hypothetical protein
VILQNPNNLAQVGLAEALVPAQLDGRQPELRFTSSLLDMHVSWLIRFGAVKPDAAARSRKTVGTRAPYNRQAGNTSKLRLEWPSDIVQELTDVVANQILTVTEHQAAATNAPSLSALKSADGTPQLRATGQTNLRYPFQASTNLVQCTKIAVSTSLTGTLDFTPPASSSPQRFYRVQVP